jgi:WhiB family transcriptional regulator, redox-sensing transcriptional regulator
VADVSRLPGPVADIWEWQLQGACREADPRLFFHTEGERGAARRGRDDAARAVCAGCPVIDSCRRHALTVREPYGVWGGLSEDDRELIYARDRGDRMPAAS